MSGPPSPPRPALAHPPLIGRRAALVALTLLAAGVYGYGLQGQLPHFNHVDEPHFVGTALGMNARGSWNPRWFGNPGSTLIYPLSATFGCWDALAGDGVLFYGNPELPERLRDGGDAFYYFLGRLVNLAYAIALVPLGFLVGRAAFGERAAALGVLLILPAPLLVEHAKIVRTDVAGAAFALLALHAQLRLLDEGAGRRCDRWLWAGAAVGLATATRYLLLALLPGLLVAAVARVWRGETLESAAARLGAATLAVPLGFLVVTPYALLDWSTLYANVALENRGAHLGADGRGPLGNLQYYAATLPALTLAPWLWLSGLAVGLRERPWHALTLAAFGVSLIGGMSLLSLHWARWLIPLLPPVALLSAVAPVRLVEWLARRDAFAGGWAGGGLGAGLAVLALVAAGLPERVEETLRVERNAVAPHTRVRAREWMLAHLPRDTKVGFEWYGPALKRTPFPREEVHHLAQRPLADWRAAGFAVLATSSMEQRYRAAHRADPSRYAAEVAFYDQLVREGRQLARFAPPPGLGQPTITLYAIAVDGGSGEGR